MPSINMKLEMVTLIACDVDIEVFTSDKMQERFEALFRIYDEQTCRTQVRRWTSRSWRRPSPWETQFLISPASRCGPGPESGAPPIINYDLLCAVAKLGPGDKYELHAGTESTPSVVVHVCDSDNENENENEDDEARPKMKIVQTRRPEGPPKVFN
ncbi:hypothetical protein AALO_G00001390 [Alosa alosa]|uniref:Uncharacterized protein n=1 Tax=Alosa alosa TaxID=278164 RepID=A0AAV6HI78_9TELE|nr:hypothetical protein AALO_G00001390 [Alosa alosa]